MSEKILMIGTKEWWDKFINERMKRYSVIENIVEKYCHTIDWYDAVVKIFELFGKKRL